MMRVGEVVQESSSCLSEAFVFSYVTILKLYGVSETLKLQLVHDNVAFNVIVSGGISDTCMVSII